MLRLAGAAGVGSDYATGYDAFFVVDGDGVIRYRANNSWDPVGVGAAVDAALADLTTPVAEGPPRRGFELRAPHPNPFNPSTRIVYALGDGDGDASVDLAILDLRGRLVRGLVSARQQRGQEHDAAWNGTDDAGRPVTSGAYLVRLRVDGEERSRLVTLVR